MRQTMRIIILSALLALISQIGRAQNTQISVKAEVDPEQTLVGQVVTYSLTITGSNLPDSIAPEVPGFDAPGLQVIANRQNRSMMSGSSFTIVINGKTVRQDKNAEEQVVIEYVLRPMKTGSFRIGPASVDIGGNNYKSNGERCYFC